MDDNSFRQLVESINNLEEGKKPKHWKGTDKGKPKKDQFVGEENGDYGFLSKYVAEEELEEDLVSQMKKEMGNYLKSRKDVEEEGSKPKPFNHTPKIGKDIQKPKGVKTITSKEDGMLTDDENVEENSVRDRLVRKAMKPITDKEKMFPKKDMMGPKTPSAEELAKKHNKPLDFIEKQIAKGVKIEKEHTDDEAMADEIARDHIAEKPDYYDRLAKVEEAGLKPSASAQAYMSQMDAAHAQQDAYHSRHKPRGVELHIHSADEDGSMVDVIKDGVVVGQGDYDRHAGSFFIDGNVFDSQDEIIAHYSGMNEGILDKAKDLVGWDETDDERKEREATDRAYTKHRAKKKMKKNGVTVRDVHPSELMDSEGDHEISMAHSQIQSVMHHAKEIEELLMPMDDNDQLQAWVQSKLTIANDYLSKVYHYMEHKTEHPVESKVPEESMDDMAYFQECVDTLVKHGVDENNAIEFVREQRKKALDNSK